MPRATNSPASRRRHKRVLKAAKGFRGSRSKLFRMATTHRKDKKRNYRRLWIARVSAACRLNDMSYNRLIEGLTKANIGLNRKMLSEIAIHDPEGFTKIVEQAKAGLA